MLGPAIWKNCQTQVYSPEFNAPLKYKELGVWVYGHKVDQKVDVMQQLLLYVRRSLLPLEPCAHNVIDNTLIMEDRDNSIYT